MDLLKNLNNMITAKLILTGKETYDSEYSTVSKYDALDAMIEFAKLHVEATLKAVHEYYEVNYDIYPIPENEINIDTDIYPLQNIK